MTYVLYYIQTNTLTCIIGETPVDYDGSVMMTGYNFWVFEVVVAASHGLEDAHVHGVSVCSIRTLGLLSPSIHGLNTMEHPESQTVGPRLGPRRRPLPPCR